MAGHLPKLRSGTLSDPGRCRLANEDAAVSDPRTGMFVVCDGIGGQPSGEAASNIVAHALGHLVRRGVRKYNQLDDATLKRILADAVIAMNAQLHEHASAIPALEGMGCTIIGTLVDARNAYFVHAGDSRAFLLRNGQLRQLTTDHVRTRQQFKQTDAGDLQDLGEKRLLMKYMGSHKPLKPDVGMLPLTPGDRLLLCTDGVTDPLEAPQINDILTAADEPALACEKLIDAANDAGGPDNITATVIDYAGHRPVTDADRTPPARTPQELPHNVAEQTIEALQALEEDLRWLLEGSHESASPNKLTALAAAKRRLGPEVYRTFLMRHPNQAPAHIFHQSCASPDSPWRKRYTQHLNDLEKPFRRLTGGGIRLSPLLTGDETATIYNKLWRDWRKVEKRYYATTKRMAHRTDELTLDILINHMLKSVGTLAALLAFLPRFMRETDT